MQPVKKLVLCAEPSEDIWLMMQALLRSRGIEAESAATVAEAVGKAGSRDYCLYVVDDGYTDGTNVELIRRLRSLTPAVPVLVFCTQDFAHSRGEALQAGAADYLIKPGDVLGVLSVVEGLCDQAAAAPS
jgi:DNA-binding response OmpR family regulator